MQQWMRRAVRSLTVATIVWTFVVASIGGQAPDAQLVAPIQKFIDSFNKGDVAGAMATHSTSADLTIIDEVPPFVWHGPKAFQAWSTALDSISKQAGITDQMVTISAPTRTESSGDSAYVIVPAVYTYKEKGVAMREAAQMTVVLKKGTSGWLIHGWTWTGPKPQRVAPAK
jgi:ketosteroid isomerase-like protein